MEFRKIKYHYPPKINLCRSCQYAYGDPRRGIMCGLTKSKPDFYAYCPYFELSFSRDYAVHKNDNLKSQTKHGLVEFWTFMFIFIVLLSPILDLIGGKLSVFVIIILGLLGYSIRSFLIGKKTLHLPTFAYIYAALSYEIFKRKNVTDEDKIIVYQTLVRLFGNKVAKQALTIEEFPALEQIIKLSKTLPLLDRKFLLTLLAELYVYKNLAGFSKQTFLHRIAKLFNIPDDEYFRIKEIYISKEYQYQSKQQTKNQSSNEEILTAYKILDLPSSASNEEIKKRFRQLAKKYHPDRQKTPEQAKFAEEQFKIIIKAYEKIKKYRNFT